MRAPGLNFILLVHSRKKGKLDNFFPRLATFPFPRVSTSLLLWNLRSISQKKGPLRLLSWKQPGQEVTRDPGGKAKIVEANREGRNGVGLELWREGFPWQSGNGLGS